MTNCPGGEIDPLMGFESPLPFHQEELAVAPLESTAVLKLGGATDLLIVPELEAVVPGLQDYRVVHLRRMAREYETDQFDLSNLELMTEKVDVLEAAGRTAVIATLGVDRIVQLGRRAAYGLGAFDVSRKHGTISATQSGLLFNDTSMFGSMLYTQESDRQKAYAHEIPVVDEAYKNGLLSTFSRLFDHSEATIRVNSKYTDLAIRMEGENDSTKITIYPEMLIGLNEIEKPEEMLSRSITIKASEPKIMVSDKVALMEKGLINEWLCPRQIMGSEVAELEQLAQRAKRWKQQSKLVYVD